MTDGEYSIIETPWSECQEASRFIRRKVFIIEQSVPESEEWDGLDEYASHFIVYRHDTQEAVACARLITPSPTTPCATTAKITRMAVLLSQRKQGIGRALLKELVHKSRERGYAAVVLDAQIQAQDFYGKEGFHIVDGIPFMDAGIAHLKMAKEL